MDEKVKKNIQKEGLIRGVLLGLIISAANIFAFYYLTQMVTSTMAVVIGYVVVFPILIPVVSACLFINNLREKIGGYWVFRQSVMGIFIMFFSAFIMQFIIKDMVFAKVIEPQMVQKTVTAFITDAKADFKKRNVSQKDIDQKIKEIHQELDPQKTITIAQEIQSIAFTIIFLFVLSLIFAAFFKREPQQYNPQVVDDPTV